MTSITSIWKSKFLGISAGSLFSSLLSFPSPCSQANLENTACTSKKWRNSWLVVETCFQPDSCDSSKTSSKNHLFLPSLISSFNSYKKGHGKKIEKYLTRFQSQVRFQNKPDLLKAECNILTNSHDISPKNFTFEFKGYISLYELEFRFLEF